MSADTRERLVVLTVPEVSCGFRLAGVAVEEAGDAEHALRRLDELLDAGEEAGVVAVDGQFLDAAPPDLRARLELSSAPVVLRLPSGSTSDGEDRGARLRALLARAVGYEMTFDAGEGS